MDIRILQNVVNEFMLLSFGERLDLISPGEWSDGLQRHGSIPWGSTKKVKLCLNGLKN